MEPHHLLAIGLGNVHRKMNNLKIEVESDFSDSLKLLSKSLTRLTDNVKTSFDIVDGQIGNINNIRFKNDNITDIVSALNYLDSNKVNINLETEIKNHTLDVLEFIDKDSDKSTSLYYVYTSNYIDTVTDNLYTNLNKCCVNIMNRGRDSTSTSIIYGENEYYWLYDSCEISLTTYYLNNDGKEINTKSYGIAIDPNTNKSVEGNIDDKKNYLHIWYPNDYDKSIETGFDNFTHCSKIYHPIDVKVKPEPQ